jgi:nickel-dependent lactate racemase
MQVAVDFGEERLDFELPDERVVGVWHGPEPLPHAAVKELVLDVLERPRGFPPLRQAVVPGDRVVIPFEPDLPEASTVLEAVVETLVGAGVETASIEVLASGLVPEDWSAGLPRGPSYKIHDPGDRAQLAYLASTETGRRIYLNRSLTDADIVIPIGRLGYDPIFGYGGPWSLIFPGLSDTETHRKYRAEVSGHPSDGDRERAALGESAHVSWLLGSQFHVGIVPGLGGVAGIVAGLDSEVREEGIRAVDRSWSYRAARRADLIVVGIGGPGRPAVIDDLAEGLATASRLVRHGGKIVALSRAGGTIGPALRRLAESDDPRPGPGVLRGLEGEADYLAARRLAQALAWADVYLLSSLPEEDVDDLAMVALGRPEEARRLASASPSCLFVSQAEWTRAEAAEDDE